MTVETVSPLLTLRRLLAAEKSTLLLALTISASSVLLELLPWYLLWRAVGVVEQGGSLLHLGGWLALALVCKYLLASLAGYFSHLAAFRVLHHTRLRIARALTRLPLMQLAPFSAGSLRKIIMNDVQRLEDFIAHHTVDLISALFSPLIAALFLFWLDWKMALAALLTVPLAIVAQRLCLRGMAERTREYHLATERLNSAIVEYVRGIPVMKAFSQDTRSFRLLDDSLRDYHQLVVRFTRRAVPAWSLFVVLLNASIFILLPLGLWRVSQGTLSVSALLLILMLGSGLLKPLLRVTFFGSLIRELFAGLSRMAPFLDDASEGHSAATVTSPSGITLIARDLSFSYEQRTAIDTLNMTLQPGGFYALVGPSGAGKSTLAGLLSGMLPPTSGTVTLGGMALAEMDDATRASLLAVVSQQVFLFKGSLADNLRLAQPQASDEQLWQALEIAQGRAFVEALPQGLATTIGEGGARLSGGERQRIAIARALLAETPLLILDEATAFADLLTEAAFYRALRQQRPTVTVLTIAHRLFAVQQADCLLVMEAGRLTGCGTHQQLLNEHRLYQQMWHSQSQLAQWQIRREEDTHVNA
ncbi:ABC transporter ATP-binding protein/permease [Erwinia sp. INIA-01]|uniref:ABC transporter ATP-binding protein n=1 Tax=Erwinia sp. INIA01 TaxID=2991500 RepID=UPI002224626E|nr:ABC transporter ATP-binding protein [Erwinia sp. INIA01]MCW1876819.1 ABC transporter ATP-binding protein/permease [Erwinia sp. INIA01]